MLVGLRDSDSGRRSTSDRRRNHVSMDGLYIGFYGERRSGFVQAHSGCFTVRK